MTSNKKNIKIKIKVMTCTTCAKTVEKSLENALKKLDGIIEVSVNLGTEKAHNCLQS